MVGQFKPNIPFGPVPAFADMAGNDFAAHAGFGCKLVYGYPVYGCHASNPKRLQIAAGFVANSISRHVNFASLVSFVVSL